MQENKFKDQRGLDAKIKNDPNVISWAQMNLLTSLCYYEFIPKKTENS